MKKHGAKPLRPVHPGGDVGHLEDTLTEITTTTAQRLKKWRNPLIALVVAVIAIQIGFFVVRYLNEKKQVHLNQELYDLVQGPQTRKESYVVDTARLEKLLGEVRGDPLEGYVYQTVVQFYLDRAATLKEEATGPGSAATKDPAKADPAREKGAAEALERAVALAQEAASRLPGNKDLQVWAGLVKTKIEAEREAPWSKSKRKYSPPDPSGTAPGGSGASPGGAPTPGAVPAPGAAPTPAEGKPETEKLPDSAPPAGGQGAPTDAGAPAKGSG